MLFHDEPLSLQVLDRLKAGEQALAPAFWPLEVLNSLLIGEKKGRISREQTDAFLRDLRALRPTLDYASLERACGPVQTICRDHGLTPYDALWANRRVNWNGETDVGCRHGSPLDSPGARPTAENDAG